MIRKRVQRVLAVILPWPSRQERKAAIQAAREEAEGAEVRAGEARALIAEIHEMRSVNHVSEALNALAARKSREQGR